MFETTKLVRSGRAVKARASVGLSRLGLVTAMLVAPLTLEEVAEALETVELLPRMLEKAQTSETAEIRVSAGPRAPLGDAGTSGTT